MTLRMIKKFPLAIVCIFILSLVFTLTSRQCHSDSDIPEWCDDPEIEIDIDIAPSVLNLQKVVNLKNKGPVVTVHTDIDVDKVNVFSVFLSFLTVENDIGSVRIKFYGDDIDGDFVAQFLMSDIKDLDPALGNNTFMLSGITKDKESFCGTQRVKVLNNEPSGGGKN